MFDKMVRRIINTGKAHRWGKPFALIALLLLFGGAALAKWAVSQFVRIWKIWELIEDLGTDFMTALTEGRSDSLRWQAGRQRISEPETFRSSHHPAARAAAVALSICMAFTLMPSMAFAVEAETGLCEHHPVHTAECGYQEAKPGHPCEHEHTADCYTDELICGYNEDENMMATSVDAGHVHTQDCYKLDCPHERGEHDGNHDGAGGKDGLGHDEDCGYIEAVEGHPCSYVCTGCGQPDEDSGNGNPPNGNNSSVPGEHQQEPVKPGDAERMIVTAFDELDEAVRLQSAEAGTPLEELILPDTLSATARAADGEAEPVVIEGVTWEPDALYEGTAGKSSTFTASAEGYACAAGVDWPVITVTVEKAELDEIDALCDAIDVLPTVDELYKNAPGDADPEFDAWLTETRARLEAVPALQTRLFALSGDAAAMGRITQARADKLAALNDVWDWLQEVELQVNGAPVPTVVVVNPDIFRYFGWIFANGAELKIVAGSKEGNTNILYDKDGDGEIGETEYLQIGTPAPTADGYDLQSYFVFGGSENADVDGPTKITMTGGKIYSLYGGGRALSGNADVKGTELILSGGLVNNSVYGGGEAYSSGTTASVTGDTSVTLSGDMTVNTCVFGGGVTASNVSVVTVTGNAAVTMSGGRVGRSGNSGMGIHGGGSVNGESSISTVGSASVQMTGGTAAAVYGGGWSGRNSQDIVTGNASVTLSADAVVSNGVYGGGYTVNGGTSTVDNKTVTVGGGVNIGGTTGSGIVINGGTDNVSNGADSFAIDAKLTGADGCISVCLPEGCDASANPIIATGAAESDLAKIKLVGDAADKEAYFEDNAIKVRLKPVNPAWADRGEGTVDSPYLISTYENLQQFAFHVNGTSPYDGAASDFTGRYIKLADEFPASGGTATALTTAIGLDTASFKGHFDGNNKTVELNISESDSNDQGLFGYVGTGSVVEKVTVIGAVAAGSRVGGVVGCNDGGTVQNCVNKATVTGSVSVGGAAGYLQSGTVKNCVNQGAVTGSSYVGGVAGYNNGGSMVQNCYNTGAVTGLTDGMPGNIGGVAGYNSANSVIQYCYNTGTVTGSNSVGGVVGYLWSGTVKNCLSLGLTVTAADSTGVGRVVGEIADGTLMGNQARADQKVYKNTTDEVTPDSAADGIHGEAMTVDGSVAFSDVFSSADGWDSTIWTVPDSSLIHGCALPRLNWLTGMDVPVLPGEAPVYGVSLSQSGTYMFADAAVGYGQQTAHSVTVSNTGNQPTGALIVTLSGSNADSFTLSGTDINSIAVGASDTFTVKPNLNLAAGTYTANVSVTGGSGISGSFTVRFTVSEDQADVAQTAAAKSAIERGTYTVAQTAAGTQDELKTALAQQINNLPGMSGTGITVTPGNITISRYIAAIAGDTGNVNGINGSFSFFVTLSKGAVSVTTASRDGIITAAYSGGSSSSGNNDQSTSVQTPAKPEIPEAVTTQPLVPDQAGGVTVMADAVSAAISAAKQGAQRNGIMKNGIAVSVPVSTAAGQSVLNVTIPAPTLDTLVGEQVARFDLTTNDMVSYSFSQDTLKQLDINSAGGHIVLRAEKRLELAGAARDAVGSRPVYDVAMIYLESGEEVPASTLSGKTITVKLPYSPNEGEETGNLYAVYVDDAGTVHWLTKSTYDPGQKAVIFEAEHFSVYGVGCKPAPSFVDTTDHWARSDINFVASRGLLSGTGETTFSPDAMITRGMFVAALGRLAGIDPAAFPSSGRFTDVAAAAYYAPFVEWAVSNNIINGTGENTFSPNAAVTREQMASIMYQYANKLSYQLPVAREAETFTDAGQIAGSRKEAVKVMQQAGVMNGKGEHCFEPKDNATRAETAAVLRRFLEIVIDPATAQGWTQNAAGRWQYYQSGKPVTGWKQLDGLWYYFSAAGLMEYGGWKQIGGKWYYFYPDGSMAVNTKIDECEIGPDGARIEV